jgi:hypothetical protein
MIHNRKALAISLLVLLALAFTAFPIASAAGSSIVDIAVNDPNNFSTLVTALTAADLVGALNGTDIYTVFAPTNAAFAALPPGVLDYLLANVSALSEVLTYHVVSGKALSSSLSNGQTITTLMGETITVKIDGNVMINDANVATADVEASNGVIHVIDKVLIPQSVINTLATVVVLPTSGGTTNPAPGTYVYGKNTNIVLSATASSGYKFAYWIAAGTVTPGHTTSQGSSIVDPETGQVIAQFPRPSTGQIDSLVFTANPTNITCGYGYTYQYQAVFTLINEPSPSPGSMDAVVIVMPTTGGTVNPSAGRYTYSNSSIISLSATPNSGFVFKYWLVSGDNTPGHGAGGFSSIADPDTGQIIAQFPRLDASGIDTLTFTNNNLRITCGYGYTYTYTAIFEQAPAPTPTPVATTTPNPTTTPQATASASPTPTHEPTETSGDMTLIIVAAVVIIAIIVAVLIIMMRRKK